MCGIAGIYAYSDSAPAVDREALLKVHAHLAQRGPDGEGYWQSDNARVALCHQRLAVIDLSEQAAQPMATEDRQLVISYNGEIYNYQELRGELETKGFQFQTHSDTEVLLHLYRDRGTAMLEDLSGMFAFALWDESRQGLLLARDPYGIKPLYYSHDGKTLRFASQVKALVAGGGISTESDAAGRVGFYLFGSVPEPYTLYRSIKSLQAGSSIWIDSRGPANSQQYFSISKIWADAENDSQDKSLDSEQRIRNALQDSITRHQVSDVPVGCFLSAGVDSGALLGLMTESSGQPIQTITLAFSEFANSHNDEAPLALRTAQDYGATHTTRRITQGEFQQDLPAIIEAMDQPSIDGINTWFISKVAKELGLKVAISGLGGDELFAGYPGFKDIPLWVRRCALAGKIPGLGIAARKCAMKLPGLHPKAPGMLEYAGTYAGAYLLKRGMFMPWELDQFIDVDVINAGLHELQPVKHIEAHIDRCSSNAYAKVASLEGSLYLRNQLLRDADWAGMAHGLEIRTPLVDSRLLKQLAPLLLQFNPGETKHLLANAPKKALSKDRVTRPKTGFQTPMAKWIEQLPSDLMPNPSKKQNQHRRWHWSRDWAQRIGAAF